jgi:hypothetical protein
LNEDYRENGGAGSFLWASDPAKAAQIEQVLENYSIYDTELGRYVYPLQVVNRQEMIDGVDFGAFGRVKPKELYSDYWVNHPGGPKGQLWADLFIFPIYHYNICIHGQSLATGFNPIGITLGNMPDSVALGYPAGHGGLTTADIPIVFKAPKGWPGYIPRSEYGDEVEIGDIAPTIYQIMGWEAPKCVDGKPLPNP